MDLTTRYCGLNLKNPLVASASPLTATLASAQQLEAAGIGAVILPSLFEEAVKADTKQLPQYLDQVRRYKDTLSVPVIGSLNGITESGWLEQAAQLEQSGCDALELNIFYVAADARESGDLIERRYIDLVYKLRSHIGIPVSVKLIHQFSSIAHLVKRLEETGADGVVLFNRFYLPDIDLDTLSVTPVLQLSAPTEALLRIRWIAILREQVKLSLAATGGFHTVPDILKAILAGADAVQLCSVLFQRGVKEVENLLQGLQEWLQAKGYHSLRDIQGKLSYGHLADPSGYERSNYVSVIEHNS
ncbi:MAG TPA: dihydroorotate dehydrogenase-like protein [Dongiaceae bacterium]|nr:dihydroorotate dehydrogenase-like protein [Dongiaceae bacterium]